MYFKGYMNVLQDIGSSNYNIYYRFKHFYIFQNELIKVYRETEIMC